MNALNTADTNLKSIASKKSFYDRRFIWIFILLLGFGFFNTFFLVTGINKHSDTNSIFLLAHNVSYIVAAIFGVWIGCYFSGNTWRKLTEIGVFVAFIVLILSFIGGISRVAYAGHSWIHLIVFNLEPGSIVKFCAILYLAKLAASSETKAVSEYKIIRTLVVLAILDILLLVDTNFFDAILVLLFFGIYLLLSGVNGLKTGIYSLIFAGILFITMLITPYHWANFFSYFSNTWHYYGFTGIFTYLFSNVNHGTQLFIMQSSTALLSTSLAVWWVIIFDILVSLLLLFFVLRSFVIYNESYKNREYFGAYLAFGLALWMVLQFILVLGSMIHLYAPIPLSFPFVGLDGSDLFFLSVLVGVVLRIDAERKAVNQQTIQPSDE